MPVTKVKRNRPKVGLTLDEANLAWLDEFRGGTSRSRTVDAVITAFRDTVASVAEAVADPRLDLVTRSEEILRASRAGELTDPDDVAGLVAAALALVKREAAE